MKRARPRPPRSTCPISTALEVLGDPWTLLVVRDLMFKGKKNFLEFLDAGEGIATNILADRLHRLESAGIVEKQRDPADGRKHIYLLTEKGIGLSPLLTEMVLWSARHFTTTAPPAVIREMTRHRQRFLAGVRKEWEKNQRQIGRKGTKAR